MILVDYFLERIADITIRDFVATEINAILTDYIAQYGDVSGYNLVWSLFKKDLEFETAHTNLIADHAEAEEVITDFFTRFNNRRAQLSRS